MRDFDVLVAEAEAADVSGWDFGWLDGRATEERPPWGYSRQLADRLAHVESALDVDTGGGEVLAEMPVLPPRMCAIEGWTVNRLLARTRLEARGVEVLPVIGGQFPFASNSFELVCGRHPVRPNWPEIARVLVDGGTYFAQHVGPRSASALYEFFLGPVPDPRRSRDPRLEAAEAEYHGLEIVDLRTARCRMEFYDVGAVVWILRRCVWWVPDFSVERYHDALERMHAVIERDGVFVAHSTRHLIEARRAAR